MPINNFCVHHALHTAESPGEVSSHYPNTCKPCSCSHTHLMRKND